MTAIVFGVVQFRAYVYGKHFTVFTDHLSLTHLKKQRHTTFTACNLASKLTGYDCDIVYKPGKKNVVADALSRNISLKEGQEDSEMPRLSLLQKEEEKDLGESSSSENTDFHIRKIRATRKKINTKVVLRESESSDDVYFPQRNTR